MIRALELIISDETTKGRGTEGDPVQRVFQVWTTDGRLVAQIPSMVADYEGLAATWRNLLGPQ